MLDHLHYLDIALAALFLFILKQLLFKKVSMPLPPGPRGLPLIGNLLDVPTEKEWLTFARWGEEFGNMMSISVFGQRMIIVNSARIAMDLLDKKGSIYSDRPVVPMGGELVGWKNSLALLPYSSRFRNYRKLAYQLFGTTATMKQFLPVEERETIKCLREIFATPGDFADHIRRTAGAIILRISHGYEVKDGQDPFVTIADEATDQFARSTSPGSFLVNIVPLLKYVPSWFPGAAFQKTAAKWARTLEEMVDQPFTFVKDQMAAGTAEVSFTSTHLDQPGLSPDAVFDIKWCAASLYSGGADTTVSAIYSFVKAMTLYPEIQVKAQEELDSVIGTDRLPRFTDRERLPYVNALVSEVFRWHSVTPTGLPHRVTEDDVHEGYFIPKASIVITNTWKMAHDPEVYHDPDSFNPSRFLGESPESDPREICFGFGRRICPGRILADASVFISCAMMLSVFSFSKCLKDGVVVEPTVEQSSGSISHQSHFVCSIKPRSAKAVALIQADEYD